MATVTLWISGWALILLSGPRWSVGVGVLILGFGVFMRVKVRAPLADFALDVLRDVAMSCGKKSDMWVKVRVPLAEFALDVFRDVAMLCQTQPQIQSKP